MALRSVETQTTRPEKNYTATIYQWVRGRIESFFTEDVSPDNHAIVELQRKGVWIGLALILQSLNEIDHDWYIPYLGPIGSIIPFALFLGSFFAMAMAFRPGSVKQPSDAGTSSSLAKGHPHPHSAPHHSGRYRVWAQCGHELLATAILQ